MNKYDVLQQYFGYSSFRGGQEQLIDSVLAGRDVLGIMPTGGGKSLCYQVPALLCSGITVVISPLISLMKDQVMALCNIGVPAAYMNSSLSGEQQNRVYENLRQNAYKILYIAPERLESDGFIALARMLPITMVAVDEAHCISQWGNDFRPSYLKIMDFILTLPHRPVVAAFTATATEQVRADIEAKLKLNNPVRVITGFDRPNLNFEVVYPRKKWMELLKLVQQRTDKSGVIYCMTRKNVEKICSLLQENGIEATRYHAGLEYAERQQNQEDFVYDRKPVMVATNAFGMGIDKSNVSYVIHYNMPMSLEAYYQEAGRAGRDGEPADCILLFSAGDIRTAKMLIEYSEESDVITERQREEIRRRDLQRLNRMVEYCKTTKCLRGNILDYFGQEHESFCDACGNCHTVFKMKDVTLEAQKILSCVKRIHDRIGYYVGMDLLSAVLRGSLEKRILRLGLNEISTYGIMRDLSKNEVCDIIRYLVDFDYAQKDERFDVIIPTEASYAVLFGGERVIMHYREKPPKLDKSKKTAMAQAEGRGFDSELYERLRRLRYTLATAQKVPAYIIFSNATLVDMTAKKPTEMWAMMEVSGVGQTKAELYGESFLREIRAHLGISEASQ